MNIFISQPEMHFNKKGVRHNPLKIYFFENFCVGVYKGSFSEFDLLVKYKKFDNVTGKWRRLRTPKHIHWTVDMLLKMEYDRNLAISLLNFFLEKWDSVKPLKKKNEQDSFLSDKLLIETQDELVKFNKLSGGEYSITFLMLIAKLLMTQEKTNMEKAYMFKRLLVELKKTPSDIHSIVAVATHNGR